MESDIFGEVNLFEEQENEKYINAIEAIELIKYKTGNHVSNVCKFLLLKGFAFKIPTYTQDYLGRIFNRDHRIDDIDFEDWARTNDILEKGLENFECKETDFTLIYDKKDLQCYYWLKLDFFSFQPIQKLNILPSDYTDYLTGKVLLWMSKQKKDTLIEDMQELDKNELKAKTFKPPLFYLNDTFSLIEASCLLSGDNPAHINRCFNDTNFDQNYPFFNEAYSFLNSAIWADNLPENLIPSHQLKIYLQSKGKIIEGFNDNLPSHPPIGCGLPSIQQLEPSIDNLNAEIARLKQANEDKNKTVIELQERIQELEASQADVKPITQDKKPNLLTLIFDETQTDRYSPDLVLSIKLWEHIYITNTNNTDSHSSKADTWLKQNTGYDITKKAGSASKIREIATPFVNWGTQRDKKYKK